MYSSTHSLLTSHYWESTRASHCAKRWNTDLIIQTLISAKAKNCKYRHTIKIMVRCFIKELCLEYHKSKEEWTPYAHWKYIKKQEALWLSSLKWSSTNGKGENSVQSHWRIKPHACAETVRGKIGKMGNF